MGKDDDKALAQKIEYYTKQLKGPRFNWDTVKLASADVEITYAVDGANQNPRSGKCVATYKIWLNLTGTKGRQLKSVTRDSIQGTLLFKNDNLKEMQLRP